jgi:hypothetical protein
VLGAASDVPTFRLYRINGINLVNLYDKQGRDDEAKRRYSINASAVQVLTPMACP